jgi:hypothetical protein
MRAWRSLVATIVLVLAAAPVAVGQSAAPLDPMRWEASTMIGTDFGPGTPGPTHTDDRGVLHEVGGGFTATWTWTDPRLSGDVTYLANLDYFGGAPGTGLSAGHEVFTVTNDGGRWVGDATGMHVPGTAAYDTIVFRGEGGYEGLTALVVIDYYKDAQNAIVFPGEMPPLPEPSPAG